MTFNVKCPYCDARDDYAIEGRFVAPFRDRARLKCTSCGSRFVLDFDVRRISKGPKIKAHEAERARVRRERNDAAEVEKEKLAAEPGCTCGASNHATGYVGGEYFSRYSHTHYCPAGRLQKTLRGDADPYVPDPDPNNGDPFDEVP